ncbi:MAG: hypothetical protein QGH50_21265 [SAR324 cluster bacterium]|nr:hypothetical protein [SAR324 cluster bacterium]
MSKRIIIIGLLILLVFPKIWAQEKMPAALAPMGALGVFSEMEKQIIFNSLQEALSTHYLLASQKSFEVAQEKAFEELDYEECTEDQCFALIQQILQVDNLFLFNMTREGTFTQLSLTRVDLDSQRLVRTAICEDCGIGALNAKVEGMVRKILEEDADAIAGTPIKEPEPEPEPEPELVVQRTDTSSTKVWHYTAASITVVSALLSNQAAASYNSMSDKNQELANSYASTQSASTKSEYESNQSTMKGYKSQVQTYDTISLVGLGWWAYLFFTDSGNSTAKHEIPKLNLMADQDQFNMRWQWKF